MSERGRSCGRQMVWPPGSLTIDFSGFPVYSSRRTEFPAAPYQPSDGSFLIIDPRLRELSESCLPFPFSFPSPVAFYKSVSASSISMKKSEERISPPRRERKYRRFRDICERVRGEIRQGQRQGKAASVFRF